MLHDACVIHLDGAAQGLLPAMVLGDTSLQSPEQQTMFVHAGLAHLSAVSGGNVAIVVGSVMLLSTLCAMRPQAKWGLSLGVLALYVWLVGPEPSVIRAGIMGTVAIVAMMSHTKAPSMHALSLAVIVMLVAMPTMATNYGFALSVAATAGIVALQPVFYQVLAIPWLPDIVRRVCAVSIAADIATVPIVALMSGKISLVSVAANILVAPVVTPITVLGLVATMLALCPGGLEVLPLLLAEPCAQWIGIVAEHSTQLPGAVVVLPTQHGMWWALIYVGWLWYLYVRRRWWLICGLTLCAVLLGNVAP